MPVNIPDTLPASEILKNENVFVMNESRALAQDIRPLKIAILNLMPIKIKTETHLLRMLSNSPIQVEVTLVNTESHTSSHTPLEHLKEFYKNFSEIKHLKFDGLIITGAPIEHLPFEEVNYWSELQEILDWADTHVTSLFSICWGAQAALYHYYGIQKYEIGKKLFGVFEHSVVNAKVPLMQGYDDVYYAPHSRFTETKAEDIEKVPELELISVSEEAGVYIVMSRDGKRIFVTGHSEYDFNTLNEEYQRDVEKGMNIEPPKNYFPNNDPSQRPVNRWKGHGNLLFSNWLNYYVYQTTPFEM